MKRTHRDRITLRIPESDLAALKASAGAARTTPGQLGAELLEEAIYRRLGESNGLSASPCHREKAHFARTSYCVRLLERILSKNPNFLEEAQALAKADSDALFGDDEDSRTKNGAAGPTARVADRVSRNGRTS